MARNKELAEYIMDQLSDLGDIRIPEPPYEGAKLMLPVTVFGGVFYGL